MAVSMTHPTPQYLLNGHGDAGISPLDRGFAYGDGVFRTMQVKDGAPVKWTRHYRKLVDDCNLLGIVCPSADILLGDIRQLFSGVPNGTRSVAKIVITRGEAARGYAVPALAQPTRLVTRSDYPAYPPQNAEDGIQLHLCKLQLGHQPAYAGIKHLNRLENVLARMEWNDATFADGLLLDTEGNVIECTMSNVFARFGSQLVTPDLHRCGVAGITRDIILESAEQLKLDVDVQDMTLETLLQADEVIVCNSLFGAWQVRSLAGKHWPKQQLASKLRSLLQE